MEKSGDNTYFGQDTYIKLSDYNRLRELINLKPVSLKQGQYILHGKASVENDLKKITKEVQIKIDKKDFILPRNSNRAIFSRRNEWSRLSISSK